MDIIVGGIIMTIPIYIVKKIPYLSILYSAKSDEMICLDRSPKFLGIIIEFIRDQQSLDSLKTLLMKEFEDTVIKENLKYLGMDQLLNKLYDYSPSRMINGRYVVNTVQILSYSHTTYCKCINHDDDDKEIFDYADKLYEGYIALYNNGEIIENYTLGINNTIKRINVKDKKRSVVFI